MKNKNRDYVKLPEKNLKIPKSTLQSFLRVEIIGIR